METLIRIWGWFGYVVYWLFWLGSVVLFDISIGFGIIVGIIAFVIHLIVLQVLYWINKDGWIWDL